MRLGRLLVITDCCLLVALLVLIGILASVQMCDRRRAHGERRGRHEQRERQGRHSHRAVRDLTEVPFCGLRTALPAVWLDRQPVAGYHQ
jgi:hypothetical protein